MELRPRHLWGLFFCLPVTLYTEYSYCPGSSSCCYSRKISLYSLLHQSTTSHISCPLSWFVVIVEWLNCVWLFSDTMDFSPPAPLPMGFPRKEYWRGFHFLLQRIFPIQGPNPCLLLWQVDSLPMSHLGSPVLVYTFLMVETPSAAS